MKKGAVNYILRLFAQKILGLLCFLLGAWWSMTWQAYIYFAMIFVLTAISVAIIYRINPETLAQRGKVITDSPLWDKVLVGLYWLLHSFVIYLVAGLGAKHAAEQIILFWVGLLLSVASAAIATAALVVNTYLESTARIQKERGQTVIRKGVYRVVRHPTYAAILLSCISIFFVFPTLSVFITAIMIAALIIIRTYLEDIMLQEKLQGYLDYTQTTKYRLIPYIW